MNPFENYKGYEGFLVDELWRIWTQDVIRAVLFARAWSKYLPQGLVHQASIIQQQAQVAEAANQESSQRLRLLGIPWVAGTPVGIDPNRAMFIGVLAFIRAGNGDPPASPEAIQIAELVLTGKRDPVDAVIASVPAEVRQQVAQMITAMQSMGMDAIFRLAGTIQAALALPRERIDVMLPKAETHQLLLGFLYANACSIPRDQKAERLESQTVFRGLVAGMIISGIIGNSRVTLGDVDKLSFDELTRRLMEIGWLPTQQ